MIVSKGYFIEQYPNEGKIVIGIPRQAVVTTTTMSGTMSDVTSKGRILTDDVLVAILNIVIQQCEWKDYQ